jgi:hypothetical protein
MELRFLLKSFSPTFIGPFYPPTESHNTTDDTVPIQFCASCYGPVLARHTRERRHADEERKQAPYQPSVTALMNGQKEERRFLLTTRARKEASPPLTPAPNDNTGEHTIPSCVEHRASIRGVTESAAVHARHARPSSMCGAAESASRSCSPRAQEEALEDLRPPGTMNQKGSRRLH